MSNFPDFDPSVPHKPEEARQWLMDKALYDAITAMTELLRQMAYPRITVGQGGIGGTNGTVCSRCGTWFTGTHYCATGPA